MSRGIQQVSVLDSSLFVIYINDIFHNLRPRTVICFPGDTTLLQYNSVISELSKMTLELKKSRKMVLL